MTAAATRKQPDYGIDAPGVLFSLLGIGIALQFLGALVPSVTIASVTFILGHSMNIVGALFLAEGLLMFIYVKRGKFRHRDRMLAQVDWRGNEQVLDVGTGRGLLMIGAARRLTTGHSVGIDIWSTKDLSGNAPNRTLENIAIEGVSDKCEIRSDDATRISFAGGSFDVVLSNLCIHNIPRQSGRDQACREIARVLRPGGVAVISDYKLTKKYAKVLGAEGFSVEFRGPFWRDVFPPMRIFVARKPI